jgi:hypothetical protein
MYDQRILGWRNICAYGDANPAVSMFYKTNELHVFFAMGQIVRT